MLKTLKRFWRKHDFQGIYKFVCRLPYILAAIGFCLYCVYFVTDGKSNMFGFEGERRIVRQNIEKSLNNHWVQKAGEDAYLNVSFSVDEIPHLFTREDVEKEVVMQLKPWNYKVEARKSNRENGFVVKEDYRYESRVRAFYTTDVEVDGKTEPRLWLVSQSYLNRHGEDMERALAKYEIAIPK